MFGKGKKTCNEIWKERYYENKNNKINESLVFDTNNRWYMYLQKWRHILNHVLSLVTRLINMKNEFTFLIWHTVFPFYWIIKWRNKIPHYIYKLFFLQIMSIIYNSKWVNHITWHLKCNWFGFPSFLRYSRRRRFENFNIAIF